MEIVLVVAGLWVLVALAVHVLVVQVLRLLSEEPAFPFETSRRRFRLRRRTEARSRLRAT